MNRDDDIAVSYARGDSINDAHPKTRTVANFAAFVAALDRDRAPTKASAGYVCGPLNGDGRRCAEGALPRVFLALDFDRITEEVYPDLCLWFSGRFSGCGWTTHSSTPAAPRQRVIIELSRQATRAECILIGTVLAADIMADPLFAKTVLLDPSTFRSEQPIYLPPTGVKLSRFTDEPPLDVDLYLQGAAQAQEAAQGRAEQPKAGQGTAKTAQGGRNKLLSDEAFRLRKKGLDVNGIFAVLMAMNAAACDPPLGEAEVRTIANGKKGVEPDPQQAEEGRPELKMVTAEELLRAFVPIESVIDGLPMGRGALVTVTGRTGAGKTTLATLMQIAFCRGLQVASRDVTQGSVLVLAGENPDDYAMHLAAAVQELGLTGKDLSQLQGRLLVVPGSFNVVHQIDWLHAHVQAMGIELVAVFVDTSVSFFAGDDENDNIAMRRHASSLRELTTLPGRPMVVALCHPVKNATRDNLLPRGGGAFLNEVDANLTLWQDEGSDITTLHWAGKIRGPTFAPVRFQLVGVTLDKHVDCRGRPIHSAIARHLEEAQAEDLEAASVADVGTLLKAMLKKPGVSLAVLANACGWSYGQDTPDKTRVLRMVERLKKEHGLTEKSVATGAWVLTPKGKKSAESLA